MKYWCSKLIKDFDEHVRAVQHQDTYFNMRYEWEEKYLYCQKFESNKKRRQPILSKTCKMKM